MVKLECTVYYQNKTSLRVGPGPACGSISPMGAGWSPGDDGCPVLSHELSFCNWALYSDPSYVSFLSGEELLWHAWQSLAELAGSSDGSTVLSTGGVREWEWSHSLCPQSLPLPLFFTSFLMMKMPDLTAPYIIAFRCLWTFLWSCENHAMNHSGDETWGQTDKARHQAASAMWQQAPKGQGGENTFQRGKSNGENLQK